MADHHDDPPIGDGSSDPDEEPNADSGFDPQSKREPEGDSPEEDLDALLAQAGELADRLGTELGIEDEDVTPDGPEADVASDDTPTLDEELAQLEQLVDTASKDVGQESRETSSAGATPDAEGVGGDDLDQLFQGISAPPPIPPEVLDQALESDGSQRTEDAGATPEPADETPESESASTPDPDDDVPDFMREFMEPEEEPEPPEPAKPPPDLPKPVIETTPVPVRTKPGVIGTGYLQSAVKEEEAPAEAAPEKPEEPVVASATPLSRWLAPLRFLRRLTARLELLGPTLSDAAYRACDYALNLLERPSRPLNRFDWRVRVLIGWAAVATFLTSVIVYVLSMF